MSFHRWSRFRPWRRDVPQPSKAYGWLVQCSWRGQVWDSCLRDQAGKRVLRLENDFFLYTHRLIIGFSQWGTCDERDTRWGGELTMVYWNAEIDAKCETLDAALMVVKVEDMELLGVLFKRNDHFLLIRLWEMILCIDSQFLEVRATLRLVLRNMREDVLVWKDTGFVGEHLFRFS